MNKRIPHLSASDLERFWSKVNKYPGHGPNGDCWVWTAAKTAGYGNFGIGSQNYVAHRVSYLIEFGSYPGKQCNHHCDNRACVNPAHLYSGNAKTNARDRSKRGRSNRRRFTTEEVKAIRKRLAAGELQSTIAAEFETSRACICNIANGKTYPVPGRPHVHKTGYHKRGEQNPRSKLTEQDVREIRERYAGGDVSSLRLAAEYGVSKQTVLSIIHRRLWSHI